LKREDRRKPSGNDEAKTLIVETNIVDKEANGTAVEQPINEQDKDSEINRLRSEVIEFRKRYDNLTARMMENSRALSVLARNLEESRLDGERRIVQYVNSIVAPMIDRLENKANPTNLEQDILLSLRDLQALKVGDGKENSLAHVLTESELRIATLIKNGLTNDEIATRLNISSHTVRTHRRNIRKKLDLNKSGQNLRSYLKNRMAEKPTPRRRASDWAT
jgi:DNA-binding CsgD family transcriptional regulator